MSRNFLTPINLNQLELQNGRIQNLATAPGAPVVGQIYFDTVLLSMLVWNGTSWANTDATKLVAAIPNAALATNPLARANHTGTQLSATISDLSATVHAFTLDSFAAPVANIAMNSKKITGLAVPTISGDAAEFSWVMGQVQSAAAGIASKVPVRLLTTSNVSLSGLTAIDGVTPIAGDRILVTGQTTASANGIYTAASGAWTRTTIDGPAPGEIETGAMWLVTEGSIYAGTQWRLSTTGAITVGTTSLSIVQFSASSLYTAGNGISLSGTSFSVNPVASGGIVVSGSGVAIDTSIVARKFVIAIGDGSSLSYVVTHNLGNQDVHIQVKQSGSPFGVVECDMNATTSNTVTIAFAVAPALNAYRVVVIG